VIRADVGTAVDLLCDVAFHPVPGTSHASGIISAIRRELIYECDFRRRSFLKLPKWGSLSKQGYKTDECALNNLPDTRLA
jgi:hypothetical protein